MKAVFQRVDCPPRVRRGGGQGHRIAIGPGALVLLGVEADDTPEEADLHGG